MEPVNQKIGDYTILTKIGDGGMAEVFRAKRLRLGGGFEKLVALKKIVPNLASNPKFRENFINEARICSELVHENIVRVYEFCKEDNDLYLVMELIDGLTLEQIFTWHRTHDEPIRTPVVMSIITQILEGLKYAHEFVGEDDKNGKKVRKARNIIHRDLKPSNILIDDVGVVKIVDFGVAKADNRKYETKELTAKGTASYMSPEQILADQAVTQSADVFSVGLLLYELLTTERLFDGEHVFAILRQVATLDIQEYLAKTILGNDKLFLPILKKALARDVNERYPKAGEMLRDLVRLPNLEHSPRILADHLRKIRNENENPESAQTRLVNKGAIESHANGQANTPIGSTHTATPPTTSTVQEAASAIDRGMHSRPRSDAPPPKHTGSTSSVSPPTRADVQKALAIENDDLEDGAETVIDSSAMSSRADLDATVETNTEAIRPKTAHPDIDDAVDARTRPGKILPFPSISTPANPSGHLPQRAEPEQGSSESTSRLEPTHREARNATPNDRSRTGMGPTGMPQFIPSDALTIPRTNIMDENTEPNASEIDPIEPSQPTPFLSLTQIDRPSDMLRFFIFVIIGGMIFAIVLLIWLS